MAYSDKKNILELVALMDAFGIHRVVLSPGSRNAPLIHTFMEHPDFTCNTIVDERSAAFFALGIAQRTRKPVALCCTSGTALLNYGPAVAEAFYQGIPLLIISADRPAAWIGQADGQTLPQPGVFGSMVKKSVQLPEITTSEEQWYCNRLINEAIIALTQNGLGPVHINIPLSEPLYQFTEKQLPKVRIIRMEQTKPAPDLVKPVANWHSSRKRMIVIGQMEPNERLNRALSQLAKKTDVVILTEHLSNITIPQANGSFDAVLSTLSDEELKAFVPELVISAGGHLTSKRIKQFLRQNPPAHLWDIRPNGQVIDTYQHLTHVIPMEPDQFFEHWIDTVTAEDEHPFFELWNQSAKITKKRLQDMVTSLPFSDLKAVSALMLGLPDHVALQISNSSPLRYAQLFPLKPTIEVFVNRGTNGIDGALSTTVGFASENSKPTFLLIGDLSFFYDVNGLWNRYVSPLLRIVLLNNGGGNLFHLIAGPRQSSAIDESIAYKHNTTAKERASTLGFEYLEAHNEAAFQSQLPLLWNSNTKKPLLLEIFTDTEVNRTVFHSVYQSFKNHKQ
ncbi:MAG: 2-succinyl-5-enolpyruvyl-6-hydroxy-3-cyclohexene-1-carboxylic-acid synthase [Microbacter sp.]